MYLYCTVPMEVLAAELEAEAAGGGRRGRPGAIPDAQLVVDGRMHLYDVKMIHFCPSRCWPSHLKSRWQVEDEGEVSNLLLLGVDISASDGCVELTQSSYIVKLASTWFPDGVPESNQSNQPPADKDLPQHVADALVNLDTRCPEAIKAYQSLVGALLYAAINTRPDVAYAVGML